MAIEFVFTLILRIEQGCEKFPRKENEKHFLHEVLKIVAKKGGEGGGGKIKKKKNEKKKRKKKG